MKCLALIDRLSKYIGPEKPIHAVQVLLHIAENDPQSVAEIKQLTGLSGSALSRTLALLRTKELVYRTSGEDDRVDIYKVTHHTTCLLRGAHD